MRQHRPRRDERVLARPGRAAAWALFAGAVILFALFVYLAHAVQSGAALPDWDSRVTEWVAGLRHPVWDRVFWAATLLGDIPVLAAGVSAAAILLAVWGRWRGALLVGAGAGLGHAVSSLAKFLVERPRPPASLALIEQPISHSLPSGHAFMSLVVAGLLLFLLIGCGGGKGAPAGGRRRTPAGTGSGRRAWTAVLAFMGVMLALLVALSRVYLGAHWASDVFAGWCLGGAWLLLLLGLTRVYGLMKGRREEHRPWLKRWSRTVLATALAMVVIAALVLAAYLDPLLG